MKVLPQVFWGGLILTACSGPVLDPEISGVDIELSCARLDRDLFQTDFHQPDSAHQKLYHNYGSFYLIYLEEILRIGPGDDFRTLALAEDFVRDPVMSQVYESIQEHFTDEVIARNSDELESALRHYRYYFPDSLIPRIVYYHGGYNFGIFSTDSVIGIGLEWFLGPDHPVIAGLSFPEYRRQKMDARFLPVNAIKDWCNHKLFQDVEGMTLLENLVYYGKIMYMTEALTPDMDDDLRMNWNPGSTSWCRDNEFKIWRELANDRQTLFSRNSFEVQKWIIDGPFTSGLPQESPPMAGIWLGWQMVRDHHKRFPELKLPALLRVSSEEILKSYNPKR